MKEMFQRCFVLACVVAVALAGCPHDAGYRRWSDVEAWGGAKVKHVAISHCHLMIC